MKITKIRRFFTVFKRFRGLFDTNLPIIKIHPLFVALCAFLTFSGGIKIVLASIIAVVVHELGHSAEAYRRGYRLKKITLYPYGGVIDGDTVSKEHLTAVAIAGPIANVVLALICISAKSSFVDQDFLTLLANANVAVFAFNLLPAYPLDGARVITSLCNNEIKALKVLRITGISCSLVLFALFVISAFGKINLTLGIISVFLFAGSISGTNNELYTHVAGLAPLSKNYDNCVEVKTFVISKNTSLARLTGCLRAKTKTLFEVVDENGAFVTNIDENALLKMIMDYPPSATVGQILLKNQ